MFARFVFASFLAGIGFLSACADIESSAPQGGGGSGGRGGGGGQGGEAGCPVLDVSLSQIYRFTDARFSVQANVSPGVAGAYRSLAVIELYDAFSSPDLPELQTGTFDLGAAPDDRYGTCQHCVTVITPDSTEIPTRTFFQTAGTIEITKVDPDDWSIVAGQVTGVSLAEVARQEDGTWEAVPEGGCFQLPSWSFDTTPVNGVPCEKAEDCGNTLRQVCSPTTLECAPFECLFTFDIVCPEDQICLAQVLGENSIGACYPACSPLSSGACPDGQDCVAIDPVQKYGVCRPRGDGTAGDACSEPDVSTGCETGSLCAGAPAECQKTCAYLTPISGCPDGHVCGLSNVCLPPASGDPAAVGETCQSSWVPYRDCAPEGDGFRGLCLALYPEQIAEKCERMCRTAGGECPSGEYCAGIFSNTDVGICWKIPVCGDAVLDPLNEICDDGNAASGDGCSGDCDVAEFDVLCAAAEPLVLGSELQGTTEGGPTGYGGSCELYIVVPAKTYSYEVPGPGRLSLNLASDVELDLLVVTDCADPGTSEVACKSTDVSPEVLDIDFAEAPTGPLMIVVRGQTIPDVGAFTLNASFTPAICGDGVAVGPEVCDDGNTMQGVGFCSADCLSADWPALCASLPALSASSPNAGDTTSAPNLQSADGFCTFGTSGEVGFAYVAPQTGTLSLHLTETDANFALYVVDGCGPATEASVLSCSNVGWTPGSAEDLQVSLAEGQAITVLVDTVVPSAGGPFQLEATFR